MNCLLIDDERDSLDLLALLIQKHCPELRIVQTFTSAKEGAEAIRRLRPDLVFLDVEMPEMNGFEVLEACRDLPFELVFTTAYEQYALKAFQHSATGYLLKPIQKDQLIVAVEKARRLLYASTYAEQRNILFGALQPTRSTKEKIALHTSEGITFLAIQDIILCESDGNYTRIHTEGDHSSLFTILLKDMEEMLKESGFRRVHNSYLVNMEKVTQYLKSDGALKMKNDAVVPISRQKKQEIVDWLTRR
jgi:two-component system, LytTR family, response regulator